VQLPYADIATPRCHRLDEHFLPDRCPKPDCASHRGTPFEWQRRGSFDRKVDLRVVQRFRCKVCGKGFSSQTCRVDYRLKKPWLPLAVFQGLVSKTTLRQTARNLGSKLDTVARHLDLIAGHCEEVHTLFLARHAGSGGWKEGTFQLDELETFETDRRLCPLTVPILIEKYTRFVVRADTGTLPARGNLRARDKARRKAREEVFGRRKSQSDEAVGRCLASLRAQLAPKYLVQVQTDEKRSYRKLVERHLAPSFGHQWVKSTIERNRENLLFPINNVLAQSRDNVSRLVRRSWAHAKRERRLRAHLAVWVLYRNYVRERSHYYRRSSSAEDAGVAKRRVTAREVLAWRRILPAGA
jgi:transposase-like protein